jgi:hypothetical protein
MMKKYIKKGLVLGIILIFVGASIIPLIQGSINNNSIKTYKDDFENNISYNDDFCDKIIEEWNKSYGGNSYDSGNSVLQTVDKGYIIAGTTYSYGLGSGDVWLIKTDKDGKELWNTTIGGVSNDYGYSIQQTTSDNGYIILGSKNSNAALWMIKTDEYGKHKWNVTFTIGYYSFCGSVVQTLDDGFLIVGYGLNKKPTDHYFITYLKTDSNGTEVWRKSYDLFPNGDCYGYSIQKTTDGGYIIVGNRRGDAWLLKINELGEEVWNKTYGYIYADDYGYSVYQTNDGGYFITGGTFDLVNVDVLAVKTDSNGNEMWKNKFGGVNLDWGYSGKQTSDGIYFVTGVTNSSSEGNSDLWLLILNNNGDMICDRILGGENDDIGYSLDLTGDGGCIITGSLNSFGAEDYDIWLIKIGIDNIKPYCDITRPIDYHIYINDHEIEPFLWWPIKQPIIIGEITIEVEVNDPSPGTGINYVEFYFNGKFITSVHTEPWIWNCKLLYFGECVFKAIAYDKAGNPSLPAEKIAFKFF